MKKIFWKCFVDLKANIHIWLAGIWWRVERSNPSEVSRRERTQIDIDQLGVSFANTQQHWWSVHYHRHHRHRYCLQDHHCRSLSPFLPHLTRKITVTIHSTNPCSILYALRMSFSFLFFLHLLPPQKRKKNWNEIEKTFMFLFHPILRAVSCFIGHHRRRFKSLSQLNKIPPPFSL